MITRESPNAGAANEVFVASATLLPGARSRGAAIPLGSPTAAIEMLGGPLLVVVGMLRSAENGKRETEPQKTGNGKRET